MGVGVRVRARVNLLVRVAKERHDGHTHSLPVHVTIKVLVVAQLYKTVLDNCVVRDIFAEAIDLLEKWEMVQSIKFCPNA